jgi:hypothetical protein
MCGRDRDRIGIADERESVSPDVVGREERLSGLGALICRVEE